MIGQRIRIAQAAAVKARITDRLGTAVAFPDRRVTALPRPRRAGPPARCGRSRHRAQPRTAPRHAIGEAYRLPGEIDDDALRAISDRWRPYRTWVSVLLRIWLEDETHEIPGARRG